jgi:trigger factor
MDYIPDYLIKTQMNSMKQDFEARAKNQFNKKLEDAIKDMGYKSMDEFTQKLRESAIANIKFTLGMDTLMKLLDIKVTNADVEREIQQTANMYKLNVEDLKKNTSIVNSLKTYMLNDKIMDKLLEINNKKSKTEAKEEKPKAEVKE